MTQQEYTVKEFVRRNPVRKGFGYTRVSTDDQENNTSHEQQELDIRAEAAERGVLLVEVFHETFTGAVWRERKVFQEMRQRYLSGEEGISCLFFRTYDRLSREPAHFYIITEELKQYAIEPICVKESNDNSAIGQIIRAVILGFAKVEREKTTARTSDGKRARVVNKKLWNAGSKPPYGYDFADKLKGSLKENEGEAHIINRIMQMRADRQGYYTIAVCLNREGIPSPKGKLWSDTTIKKILVDGRSLYSGVAYGYKNKSTSEYKNGVLHVSTEVRPQEEWILLPEGTVPRIVSEELLRRALEAEGPVKQDNKRNTPDHDDYLLSNGFAKCALCGSTLVINRRRRNNERGDTYQWASYTCQNSGNGMRKMCPGVDIVSHVIDTEVWGHIEDVLRNLQVIGNAVDHLLSTDLFSSAEEATYSTIETTRLLVDQYKRDAHEPGLTGAGRAVLFNLMAEQEALLEELEEELGEITAAKGMQKQVEEEYRVFLEWCQEMRESGKKADYRHKRDALRHLGVVVTVRRKENEEGEGRYAITLSPPGLMSALVSTKVIQTSSRWSLDNFPFLLRISDGHTSFYTPPIHTVASISLS